MRRETSDIQTKITLSPRARAQIEKSFIERTIAEAWREVEGEIPCYEGRAEFAVDALDQAGFAIVAKPKPGSTAVDRVEFARRTGNWDGVSDKDWNAWLTSLSIPQDTFARFAGGNPIQLLRTHEEAVLRARATGLIYGAYVHADGKVTPLDKEAAEAGIVAIGETTLKPGNTFEIPPGTAIRSAATAAPETEQDNLGLCLRSADDLAAGYDCRVQVVGVDEARFPMSVEHDEGDHIVVTDRHSGRVVGLVKAWHSDDGDPLVPKQWLEIVLGAWDTAKEPQWAA